MLVSLLFVALKISCAFDATSAYLLKKERNLRLISVNNGERVDYASLPRYLSNSGLLLTSGLINRSRRSPQLPFPPELPIPIPEMPIPFPQVTDLQSRKRRTPQLPTPPQMPVPIPQMPDMQGRKRRSPQLPTPPQMPVPIPQMPDMQGRKRRSPQSPTPPQMPVPIPQMPNMQGRKRRSPEEQDQDMNHKMDAKKERGQHMAESGKNKMKEKTPTKPGM